MTAQKVTFDTILTRPDAPGTWTYLRVPLDVEAIYGSKSRIPVQGIMDGSPFRSTLMPQGEGVFILVVNKELRDQINKQAGDRHIHIPIKKNTSTGSPLRRKRKPERLVLKRPWVC